MHSGAGYVSPIYWNGKTDVGTQIRSPYYRQHHCLVALVVGFVNHFQSGHLKRCFSRG